MTHNDYYVDCLNTASNIVPDELRRMALTLDSMNEEEVELIFNSDTSMGKVLRLIVDYDLSDAEELAEVKP